MKGKTVGKAQAKKKIERPGLTEDEIEELREAFNLFDTEATGKIDPRYRISHSDS
jgi:Ca2+-binding EF-hand superfamily protein